MSRVCLSLLPRNFRQWQFEKVLSVALVLGLMTLAGCKSKEPVPDGSGTIESTQVQVAPEVSGIITKLPAEEGVVFKTGDLVAQLDSAEYILKRDQAKAALAQAQAQLDLMVAGSRDEDIQKARDQVREAKAVAQAANADLKRIQEVFEKNSATQKQRDDAQAAADRSAAVLAQAEQNLEKLLRGNRKEEIRQAQAQVEQARAKLGLAEKSVRDCTIYAPMNGVVTTKVHELGEYVGIGSALITLSRLDEVWLSVYVPEDRLGHVKLGQPARVKIDGVDHFFNGTVTFVSPEAEFTPKNVQTPDERAKLVYRVKITLPNPNGVFKIGMPADGYLGL